MMTRYRRWLGVWMLVLAPLKLFGQPATADKLEIIHADTMKNSRTSRGSLLELVGNVHFKQGTAEMFCGRAKYWKDANETIIEENVRVYDRNKLLVADRVFYYDQSQIFKALGHVLLRDTLQQITAELVTYNKLEDRVTAEKSVVIKDSLNYIVIFGEWAEFDNRRDYARITGQPVFIKHDSTGKEEIRITSMQMELYDGGDRAVVTDSVRIFQSKANAICGQAEFYRTRDEIFLKIKPKAWQGSDRLSGETIRLFIQKNRLRQAIVEGQAVVTSPVDTTGVDPRVNVLSGQQIIMLFENNELVQVMVENQATSEYTIVEDNEDKGRNRIVGDKITVYLADRKIQRIVVESKPQLSVGTYFPPQLVGKQTTK
ncbi:MAG: hypothetical protein ONB16_04085 [candidate division KSB1 bacterium]|nr:hypothetical protein [candidate division KSB1 bacterium]MDZ7341459.1 hypothetical protein [candidate division KSB1 bacterium]